MKRILNFARNYRKLGLSGILLLLKIYFKKNKVISFSSSNLLYPVFLRNNTSDIDAFYQVFSNKEYSIKFNFKPKVILDCGANVGYASIYFKNAFPNAKIISIEPDISNFELLQKNTKQYSDIFCLNGAIWNRDTNLIIKDIGLGNWGFIIEESSISTKESIKAYTIDDIKTKYKIDQIDIIKIDIEGSEKELFESNFENWLPKTKVLIIELHDRMRAGSSKSFFTALSKYNFSLAQSGENLIIYMN